MLPTPAASLQLNNHFARSQSSDHLGVELSRRGTKRLTWSPGAVGSRTNNVGGLLSEELPSISQQASQFQRPEIRSLIEALDKKLCARFDRVESRLEKIFEQVTNHELAEKIFEQVTNHELAAPPPTPASAAVPSPSSGAGTRPLHASSFISDFRQQRDEAEKKPEGSFELPAPDDEWPRQLSGDTNHNGYQLRSDWQMDAQALGKHMKAEDQWKTFEDFEQFGVLSDHDSAHKRWWILWPSSKPRLCWDILTMVVIAYDMATIPVHLAFVEGESDLSRAVFWPCLVFWTLDIPLSFITAFYVKGQVEASPRLIARQYMLTWFVVDLCLVGTGWAEVVLDMRPSATGLGRVGRVTKTLRILRIMRSMRLLRLVKLRRILEDLQDRITSEYVHIMMSVCRLSVVIVWTNHFIACGWWAIGRSGPSEGDVDADWSWTSHFLFQSAPLPYQYFTALHWSLTQFTPASMEICPRNLGERIYAVLVLIFAMIVFSSFVSSITAAMTQLRSLSSTVDKSFVMLRRYLRVRRTPQDLTLRIVRCVEHRLGAQKEEIPESAVQLLQLMSQPLTMELLSHVYAPYLKRHPFFRRYGDTDPVALQRVCLVAVQRLSLSTGDALFTEACNGEQIFFVHKGKLRYFPTRFCYSSEGMENYQADRISNCLSGGSTPVLARSESSMRRGNTVHPMSEYILCENDYFCENSLWCPWAHTGTMLAVEMTEVLAVEAAALARVTSSRRLVIRGTQRYGAAYVNRLNSLTEQITDVRTLSPSHIEDLAQWAFRQRSATQSSVDLRDPSSNNPSNNPSTNTEECCVPTKKISVKL